MNHSITPLGVGGSGPGSTDFYKRTNQGSEYFSLSSGYKNLSASWQNQIVSVRTAAPTASYSTTLWERTSTDGYGKGVVFKHADWYGQTANLNNFPTSAVEVKKVKKYRNKRCFHVWKHLLFLQLFHITRLYQFQLLTIIFSYSYSPKPSPYYELPIPSLIESLDVVIHQAQLTNIQL